MAKGSNRGHLRAVPDRWAEPVPVIWGGTTWLRACRHCDSAIMRNSDGDWEHIVFSGTLCEEE